MFNLLRYLKYLTAIFILIYTGIKITFNFINLGTAHGLIELEFANALTSFCLSLALILDAYFMKRINYK